MRRLPITAILCLAVLAAVLAAAPAAARPIPAKGLTREQVADWLQTKGYDAQIKHDTVMDDDYVSVTTNGVGWGIYFYACDKTRHCTSLQYSTGWNDAGLSADQIIVWDRTKRFIRAYRNDSGAVFGEYDLDIAPGGTWEALDHSLERWQAQLANFSKFVNDDDGGN